MKKGKGGQVCHFHNKSPVFFHAPIQRWFSSIGEEGRGWGGGAGGVGVAVGSSWLSVERWFHLAAHVSPCLRGFKRSEEHTSEPQSR